MAIMTQGIFWKGLTISISIASAILHGVRAEDKPPKVAPPANSSSVPNVPLAGVNLAGIEFGAQTNGLYTAGSAPVYPPESQIPHFIKQNVNLFRVPVAWDVLQPKENDKLNTSNVETYRKFIEGITTKGAYAIVDVHSYARFHGKIVGEETPVDVIVSLWTQLGAVFKDNPLVLLGLSNEPHDLDMNKWATTVQAVVTAMRKENIPNVILLSGTEYTSMKAFPQWYMLMKSIKNPDGSFDGLVFEVHRYLDSDNSGRSTECVASHADEVKQVAEMLKADKRQVILAEVGGGNTASCEKFLPEIVGAVADAFPTFLGFALWSAGSFDEKYELVLTVKDNSSPTGWKDQRNWLSISKFLPKQPVSPSGLVSSKPSRKPRQKCRP